MAERYEKHMELKAREDGGGRGRRRDGGGRGGRNQDRWAF